MMMIEERLFDQEWIQDLPADARWLFLYILSKASRKTGIFELNMRVLNFGAATERKYTADDVLTMYGGRIQRVPGHDSVGIVVDYIMKNWSPRDGGEGIIEGTKNPLYRSILAELSRYGLTMEDVMRMVGGKRTHNPPTSTANVAALDKNLEKPEEVAPDEMADAFAAFWASYPGPRKIDKKKCEDAFRSKAKAFKGSVSEFSSTLSAGLARWKETEDWQKDGGRFICAPLVWLRNERWTAEVTPKKGDGNGKQNDRLVMGYGSRKTGTVFIDPTESSDVFG